MNARMARMAATAGLGAALAAGTVLVPPAAASVPSAGAQPAPSCVTYWQSWRYAQVTNDCTTALDVKVVYQDGAEGVCHTAPPATTTTVGEGYAGTHGSVVHVGLC
jgi:hypothetical protein